MSYKNTATTTTTTTALTYADTTSTQCTFYSTFSITATYIIPVYQPHVFHNTVNS